MNLYDFCQLLQKDYLVVAVDRGQVIFLTVISQVSVMLI